MARPENSVRLITGKIMASADSAQFIVPDEIRKPWYVRFGDLMRRQPLGTAGAFVVVLMVLATIFAEVLSPYDPEMISFESMLVPPSVDHWMGTDAFGRDILTRIIYGARTALFVGFTAAFVGSTLGLILGVASAYFGGLFDLVVQRLVDIFDGVSVDRFGTRRCSNVGRRYCQCRHCYYDSVYSAVCESRSFECPRNSRDTVC